MAKVKGPLFSQKASGTLGKTLMFVCGQFARLKPEPSETKSSKQMDQEEIFLNGARKWSNDLSYITKQKWQDFAKTVRKSDACLGVESEITGYNLWQMYWMKFGEGGWDNYPDPPDY